VIFIRVSMQFWVTITTEYHALTHYLDASNTVSHETASSFVSVYCVYSVSTEDILTWICQVQYAVWRRRFTIECFWMLFVWDGIKRRHRRFIWWQIRLERNTGGSTEMNSTKAFITNYKQSLEFLMCNIYCWRAEYDLKSWETSAQINLD
jgi:hypothetical protein